jgi:glyoxylase-like metal-dependent hydrolase (beta-lactamase superfamily II)
VWDPTCGRAAIFDPVLDYDPVSGRTSRVFAERLLDVVRGAGLTVEWLIETHVHADHLSAAPYLRDQVGGNLGIGERIVDVQQAFGHVFNTEEQFPRDGSQFDRLFRDGDVYYIGTMQGRVMHTPGHTPACTTHVIGDAAMVGDTLFMPDYGTARCDFPGGDAGALYRSIQRILALPDETRLFLCHDYPVAGREGGPCCETTVAAERAANIHVGAAAGADEDSFVRMRQARDSTLSLPRLMVPAVQVNMRAGAMPPPETNGVSYIRTPIDVL